jgi:cell division protein FtsB
VRGFFGAQKRLLQQEREIAALKKEVDTLRAQNESMRQGMRRCVTCEYRIDFKNRQGQAPVEVTQS